MSEQIPTKERDPRRHTQIAPEVLEQVYRHALASYGEECCGLLLGPRETCLIVDEVRPCENVQNKLHALDPENYPSDARHAYNMAPRDLFFLYESFATARPVKVVYHSHVDVGAYFSEEDRRMATALFENDEPVYDLSYLVIDVQPDRVAGARLFRWDPISRDFVQTAEF